MTYEQWDKTSPVNGIEPINLIGQEQMENDDAFILFKNESNEVIAVESVNTMKAVYGFTGETVEEIAEEYILQHSTSFESLKEQKIAELNLACRNAIEAGFVYDGKLFKSAVDPDQTNIALAGLQFVTDPSAVLPWETADNQVITLTSETFPLFAGAFGQHKMTQQVKVSGLKAQAQATATPEELAAIVW